MQPYVWIFRSIVRHDSEVKYATIPRQSTPVFRGKGYHLFRGNYAILLRNQYLYWTDIPTQSTPVFGAKVNH